MFARRVVAASESHDSAMCLPDVRCGMRQRGQARAVMWLVMEEQPHCHAVRAAVVPREREKDDFRNVLARISGTRSIQDARSVPSESASKCE